MASHEFEFHGYYKQENPLSPWRPFIRLIVGLTRISSFRKVEMLVDTGADITTLQPRDSLLFLEESQFRHLGGGHEVLAVGGNPPMFSEEAAIGFELPDSRVCWIPIMIDIAQPSADERLFSTLGNDVMQYGTTIFDAPHATVTIKLWLDHPIITQLPI